MLVKAPELLKSHGLKFTFDFTGFGRSINSSK